jgi:hypothetical protein
MGAMGEAVFINDVEFLSDRAFADSSGTRNVGGSRRFELLIC